MSIRGTFTLPGDKSLSHRALIFAAMSNGESQISNLSDGNDVVSTRDCLVHCGIKIFDDGQVNELYFQISQLASQFLKTGMEGLGINPLERM